MTDDARNHGDSAGDRHGRAAEPAQVSAEPAQVSAVPAQVSVVPAQVSVVPAQESVPARERHRRFQCSARTMLFGTALIASGLGLFVNANKIDRARRAVAAIEAIRGTCMYRDPATKPSKLEAWLRLDLPRSYFDEVITVHAAGNTMMTDANVAHLSALTSLEDLDLSETRVTDAGLEHLSTLTSLRILNLSGTLVTDAGLEYLSTLTSIQDLNLSGTLVTDAGLEHLSALTSLNWLDLRETQVTDAAVTTLRKGLPFSVIRAK